MQINSKNFGDDPETRTMSRILFEAQACELDYYEAAAKSNATWFPTIEQLLASCNARVNVA